MLKPATQEIDFHYSLTVTEAAGHTVIAHGVGGALLADAVKLVNEQDAGRRLARLLEHVAHSAGAHAHEDLHELRAGSRVEGDARLARNCLGQQRLS